MSVSVATERNKRKRETEREIGHICAHISISMFNLLNHTMYLQYVHFE